MDSREALIMVLDSRASNKVTEAVRKRVVAKKCLCCETDAVKRGLCQKCYTEWRTTRMAMSNSQRARYDAKLIRIGKLLSAYGRKEYVNQSIFSRIAKEAS